MSGNQLGLVNGISLEVKKPLFNVNRYAEIVYLKIDRFNKVRVCACGDSNCRQCGDIGMH